MRTIEDTHIWEKTLKYQANDEYEKQRERLRACFLSFRENVSILANEIHRSMPNYTNHDITHLDALWEMADIIIGEEYKVTPTEAFILGGAILLHDIGMGLASYPNGMEEIAKEDYWKDMVSNLYLKKFDRMPLESEILSPDKSIETEALSDFLRKRHADQAERLANIFWESPTNKNQIFLINDTEVRISFGRVIGKIANSHWWDIKKLESEFSRVIGAPSWCPKEWIIDPLKIACILRVADAAHIDARRAPQFQRTLRKLKGLSDLHWGFQEKLLKPYLKDDSLNYTSGYAFDFENASQWWLCYETLILIDKELRQVDALLADKGMQRFSARRVFGVESSERLTSLIPVDGWVPFDAFIHVGDIPKIIRSLGGEELYGKNYSVAIRELIQNSSDAIRARRIIDNRDENFGEILINYSKDDEGEFIEVEDNGIGMTVDTMRQYLLNFGESYWNSELIRDEYPGFISSGTKQTGKFGIGFFSVFMLGEKIKVITKQYSAAQSDTYVLEFGNSLYIRPIIRKAISNELLRDGGTRVKIWFKSEEIRKILFTGRMRKVLSLEELILLIAPGLDTRLNIKDLLNNTENIYEANYWLKCSNEEFVKYVSTINWLKGFDNDKESINNTNDIKQYIIDNLSLIKENDEIIGRACIGLISKYTSVYKDGIVTVGGLFSNTMQGIFGIIKGTEMTASRDNSIFQASNNNIAQWVSQSNFEALNCLLGDDELIGISQYVRILGGNSSSLIIAKNRYGKLTKNDFVKLIKDMDEIIIIDISDLKNNINILKEVDINDNVFISNILTFKSIIDNENHIYSYNKGYYGMQLMDYTNMGYMVEAISEAWCIDINKIFSIDIEDYIFKYKIPIGISRGNMILEEAYVFNKSVLI